MEQNMQPENRGYVINEYDVLKKVILCQPQYMTIRDVINETQKHFKDEGIHIEVALQISEWRSSCFHIIKNTPNKYSQGISALHSAKPFLLLIWRAMCARVRKMS